MSRRLRCMLIAVVVALAAPPAALAATVDYVGQVDQGGPPFVITMLRMYGDDGPDDAITVSETATEHVVQRAGGGLVLGPAIANNECTGGGAEVRCARASSISADLLGGNDRLTADGVTVPLALAGGAGNDELSGGEASDVLAGGPGNDTLTGRAGVDEFFGEGDDDVLEARDGVPERLSCGAGNDQARNDYTDIIADCERGVDQDADGFLATADCRDGDARIFPGAPDPENGVDEDCDGADDRNLDRDGDGFPIPADCDDGRASIRPGALERRGNDVDENCDDRAEPFTPLAALVSARFAQGATVTTLRTLIVRNAPRGARVRVTCSSRRLGCRFSSATRTVARDLAPVSLGRLFRGARLRAGARITARVSAPESTSRTYAYVIGRGAPPSSRTTCQAPGGRSFPC
jgi:hypothetical protein